MVVTLKGPNEGMQLCIITDVYLVTVWMEVIVYRNVHITNLQSIKFLLMYTMHWKVQVKTNEQIIDLTLKCLLAKSSI